MCEVTESESMERRLDSLAAEVEVLKARDADWRVFLAEALGFADRFKAEVERLRSKVVLLERDIDVGTGNAELLEVEVERLKAELEQFRGRAERAERECDRLLDY